MSNTQVFRAIMFGIAFWFAAAMVIHWLPGLFDAGRYQALLFAVSIPIAWMSLPIAKLASGLERPRVIEVIVIGTIAATFLDGLALTWFPALYAGLSPTTQYGAAWILWGVGWLLLFARWRSAQP